MRNAIDFSFARPTPEEVAAAGVDILVYTGPARPDVGYIQAMRAAGVAVTLIQESDPNRSQQGYGAGVADAQYADSRADQVGYPTDCAIAYVVSDGSAGDPNSGGDGIAAYGQGIAATSRRPFFFYGNEYATSNAMRGAPGALGTWIPSTWGSGTLMSQEANIASPIPDTDLNTVHAAYGAWGGDAAGDGELSQQDRDIIGQWLQDDRELYGKWMQQQSANVVKALGDKLDQIIALLSK